MSDLDRQIADAIRALAGTDKLASGAATIVLGKVLSVDIPNRCCNVETISGATMELSDVGLMAALDDGFLLVPVVGSNVLVIYGQQVKTKVIMYSELQMIWCVAGDQQIKMTASGIEIFNDFHSIEVVNESVTVANKDYKILLNQQGIQMNDGSFGGLTKTPTLRQELNKTHDILSIILNIIKGTPINEPGNGAPSALQTALNTAIGTKQLGVFTDIENSTVKHGK